MKRLPIGIQNFRKIIEGDCLYADKTEYIYNLIQNASYYFLSRPRRFGKSLLLDTIAEVFKGEKDLTVEKIDYSEGAPAFTLCMPNKEVKDAFNLHVLSVLAETDDAKTRTLSFELKRAFRSGDIEMEYEII